MQIIAKLYRYRRGFSQSDETGGILKQLKSEMSADLTAFRKKGLDRKTNHHDLTKAKTEEICTPSKAIQEKAEALPRPARPPPWRDKLQNKGEGSEVVNTTP